eukprot:TRINITY_DN94258_c0_g1_i1.p1 TRINITY_DN94258_c0_g1~~TRINITY_DN94258_c0_g1_i1.p1  ORF type:complete len:414 (-),score=78.71 TRINITY_DN94258_c0_g1_i1:41-1282(-)
MAGQQASPALRKRLLEEAAPIPRKRHRDIQVLHGVCGRLHASVEKGLLDTVDGSMFKEECAFMPPSSYIEKKPDIDYSKRGLLVNRLVSLHVHFNLSWPTLFFAVNFLDRYLAHVASEKCDLQLVAVTSMCVASKFVEVDPPRVQDVLELAGHAGTIDDVSLVECSFLAALDFRLACPTVDQFLERLRTPNGSDEFQQSLAQYLVELTLLDAQFLRFPPSMIAAAAMLLSNSLSQRHAAWPENMSSVARYPEDALQGCAQSMLSCVTATPADVLQAVQRRYRASKYYAGWGAKLEQLRQAQRCETSPGAGAIVASTSTRKGATLPTIQFSTGKASSSATSVNKSSLARPKKSIEDSCKQHKCAQHRVAMHRQAFDGMCRNTVAALKAKCKARSLPCSGSKEELALKLIDAMFH